jgi:hypothetical protein
VAIEAMRSVARPELAGNPPQAAGPRGRWSDVPLAAEAAALEAEMAIFRVIELPGSYEFVLRTIDDRPARLNVTKRDDPRVYDAEAEVGRFGNDNETRDALLRHFDEFMARFGRKRSIQEP